MRKLTLRRVCTDPSILLGLGFFLATMLLLPLVL
jgi:hypothetical protein